MATFTLILMKIGPLFILNKITWKIFTNSKLNQFKLTQKIFSTWYGLILDNRIKMGKAQAMADWRLSYKVFNSWKRISVTEKVKKEAWKPNKGNLD